MKNLFILITSLFFSLSNLLGQCANFNGQWPTAIQTTTSNTLVNATTCAFGGDYGVYSVTAGETYTWSTCGDTDFDTQLTLSNTAHSIDYAYNDDDCGVQSTITWTATFTGTVHVLVSQYNCSNNSTCMTVQWACTSCGSGGGGSGCINTTSFGSEPAPTVGGTSATISTCAYQDEYSTISNVVAGETYEVNSDCGGYITVRSGTPGGPIVDEGSAPLSWTATTNGDHYVHWNTNSACGTATNCCTTTISCSSCPAPTPPANDDCSTAFPVTVNTDGTCSSVTAGSIEFATASPQSTTACSGTEDDDIWFSFTAPASGNVDFNLQNITGSTSDLYHSVWEGSCPSLTNVAGSCSDPNSSSLTGLTPGQTYYVRVYSYTGISGQNSSFDLCITATAPTGPCGNPENNDYCSNPATLTQGGSGWSSSTTDTYSEDTPANTGSLFCGSIENNSWYVFTAQSTTETFDFTSVTNCVTGDGIQAEVFEIVTDTDGCCTSLSSVSNCWNPATSTSGTVTATGLTVGNNYYLMVDGWAGDNCDFTVSGWEATGILPVELIKFEGHSDEDNNKLIWVTASEQDNDYFLLEHSLDGINWSNIEEIDGAGTTSEEQYYSTTHRDFENGVNYYRLTQVDFNGNTTKHDVISIDNTKKKKLIKRINMMGQEVTKSYKGLVILYFKDGSIKKILQ